MKNIGIDARLYFETGVGVYLRNFLHYLQEQAPKEYQFSVYVLARDSSLITLDNTQFIKREVTTSWHSISEQTSFYRVLMKDNLDLMHFTYFSYPILYRKKFIATIHDLTPLLHKTGKASTRSKMLYDLKYLGLKFVLSQQVRNAYKIITPTQAVKDQIIETYGSKYKKKIIPIYEGVNYEFFNTEENETLQDTFINPYLLCVGNLYPHKNIDRLISAFAAIESPYELVLAGPDNYFSAKIERYIREKKIRTVRIFHPKSIKDLVYLYSNAQALVNPSLSEGFGLPVVEASYFGKPVIASDLPVFKELLGREYLSFDPKSIPDIVAKIRKFIDNPIVFNSQKIAQKYSFEKMTAEYIKLLSTILH